MSEAAELDWLRRWVSRELGLAVPPHHPHLLEDRLRVFIPARGMSLAGLTGRLRAGDRTLAQDLADALTTNETSWFRDVGFFQHFGELLSSWPPDRQLSVWSAASSAGQELYSTAILSKEHLPAGSPPPTLVGSDLSATMIARARSARYSQAEVARGLPARLLVRHFRQDGLYWTLNEDIRSSARFFTHNVVRDPPPGLFDVVMCRYLLIYFDEAARRRALESLAGCLKPGGFIVLGSSEMLGSSDCGLDRHRFGSGWVYARS